MTYVRIPRGYRWRGVRVKLHCVYGGCFGNQRYAPTLEEATARAKEIADSHEARLGERGHRIIGAVVKWGAECVICPKQVAVFTAPDYEHLLEEINAHEVTRAHQSYSYDQEWIDELSKAFGL